MTEEEKAAAEYSGRSSNKGGDIYHTVAEMAFLAGVKWERERAEKDWDLLMEALKENKFFVNEQMPKEFEKTFRDNFKDILA